MREWQPLVDLLNTTFVAESAMNADVVAAGSSLEFILAALGFLTRLLRYCENKKYFTAFEVYSLIFAGFFTLSNIGNV